MTRKNLSLDKSHWVWSRHLFSYSDSFTFFTLYCVVDFSFPWMCKCVSSFIPVLFPCNETKQTDNLMRQLSFTDRFKCLAGDWTSKKWEAYMGASYEMGWNESCFWRSALPAVVQSIHRPASAAPVAVDPRSTRRVRVFCLRAGLTGTVHQHLIFLQSKISSTPFLPRTEMDLCSLSLSFMCGWQEDRLLQWNPSASQPPLKMYTLTCWCRPNTYGLYRYGKQLEYFNMRSFLVCLCF